jgi:hypothetical protein
LTALGAARMNAGNRALRTDLDASYAPSSSSVSASSPDWRAADLVFFYLPGCPACAQAEDLLSKVEAARPDLRIVRVPTDTDEGKRLEEEACKAHRVPEMERHLVPAILLQQGEFIADSSRIVAAFAYYLPDKDRPRDIKPWNPCSNLKGGCHD